MVLAVFSPLSFLILFICVLSFFYLVGLAKVLPIFFLSFLKTSFLDFIDFILSVYFVSVGGVCVCLCVCETSAIKDMKHGK